MFAFRLSAVLMAWVLLFAVPVAAAPKTFGPFKVDSSRPDVVEMDGAIDEGSALSFRRAMAAAPQAKVLVLNSDGGLVSMGLLIADDVFHRKLATYIPAGSRCYSACSFIFLAGTERNAEGELGVHQISAGMSNLESAQMSISDIIDMLSRFGTPTEVLTVMFRTPPGEMYVFKPDEVVSLGLNRGKTSAEQAVSYPLGSTIDERRAALTKRAPVEAARAPVVPAEKLTVIEEYATRPNRMAVFVGLDFFGSDLRSLTTPDAASCARECLLSGQSCQAFTFNVVTKGRRDNCFLKSDKGRADGNSAAVSGQLLSRASAEPQPYQLGAIDPQTNVFKNVNLIGDGLVDRI